MAVNNFMNGKSIKNPNERVIANREEFKKQVIVRPSGQQTTAEFSMWALDYARWDSWLNQVEKWSSWTNSTDNPQMMVLENYFACLNILWNEWRTYVSVPTILKNFDDLWDTTKQQKRILEQNSRSNLPNNIALKSKFVDNLNLLYQEICALKRLLGFSIPMKSNWSFNEKLDLGFGNKKDWNLPKEID